MQMRLFTIKNPDIIGAFMELSTFTKNVCFEISCSSFRAVTNYSVTFLF